MPPSVLSLIIPTIAFPKPKEIKTPIKPMEVAVAVGDDRHLPAAVPDADDGAVDDQKPSSVMSARFIRLSTRSCV